MKLFRMILVGCLTTTLRAEDLPQHSPPSHQRYQRSAYLMGTEFGIALYAENEVIADKAFRAAFKTIRELEEKLSDYDADSELSRLSAQSPTREPVTVSQELWEVLRESQSMSERSGGAFDVTVGPLTRLWRTARRTKVLPTNEQIAKAREAVGFRHIQLFDLTRQVSLLAPGMQLDLGGIAKGYASDKALQACHEWGVTSVLINGGGGLTIGEPPPGEEGWAINLVGLEPDVSVRKILVSRCGVATSGDLYQSVTLAGKRYSHLIDPRIGEPLTERISVSIIAKSGMLADALSTAVSVLDLNSGLRLIEEEEGAAGMITFVDKGEVKSVVTSRFASKSIDRP